MADGTSFLPVASEILTDRLVRAEIDREQVRIADHKLESDRSSAVSFGQSAAFRPRTIEQIFADAERAAERANSPRAAFLRALSELEQLGFYEAEKVRAIYWRTMADDRRPVDTDAALRAVRILNSIDHSTAREAVQALCDFGAPMARAA